MLKTLRQVFVAAIFGVSYIPEAHGKELLSVYEIEAVADAVGIEKIEKDGSLSDSETKNIRDFLEEKGYRVEYLTAPSTFGILLKMYSDDGGRIVPELYKEAEIKFFLRELNVDGITASSQWDRQSEMALADYFRAKGSPSNNGALSWYNISQVIENYYAEFGANKTFRTEIFKKKINETMAPNMNNFFDKSVIATLQQNLTNSGYSLGPVDGVWGQKTRKALTKWAIKNMEHEAVTRDLIVENILAISMSRAQAQQLLKKTLIENKLNKFKTIRTHAPWITWSMKRGGIKPKNYQLAWVFQGGYPSDCNKMNARGIRLAQIEWQAVGKSWGSSLDPSMISNYPYIYKNGYAPYGQYNESEQRMFTKLDDPSFPEELVSAWGKSVASACDHPDGVIFDYWHNEHPEAYSKSSIRKVRRKIAEAFREKYGNSLILMGNVNYNLDKDTADIMNGVFLEFWKDDPKREYTTAELKNIELAIKFYEKTLSWPRIIAVNGQRKTLNLTDNDRNSPENRQMAKLITAMTVVLTENGYVHFGDNNVDDDVTDHYHLYYDFYGFDIGQSVSQTIRVKSGVEYKKFQNGFIAFNRNNNASEIVIDDQVKLSIAKRSGLFCQINDGIYECLPSN